MRSAVFLASLALVACAPTDAPPPAAPAASSAELSTDDDKTVYALGLAIGQNVKDFKLTSAEVDIVAQGLKYSVLGNEPKVALDVYGPRIQVLAMERAAASAGAEKQASDAWVAEQAAQPTVVAVVWTPSRHSSSMTAAAVTSNPSRPSRIDPDALPC